MACGRNADRWSCQALALMTQMIPPTVATHQAMQAIATRRPERVRLFNSSSVIFSFPPTIFLPRKNGGKPALMG